MELDFFCLHFLPNTLPDQAVVAEDLSHLPMEHRGGELFLQEGPGPVAQAQRRPLGGFKRQAAQVSWRDGEAIISPGG